ncbi:MAG: YceI family protein [Armatimonadetes bacterium]|nr:YceI family protein [Armatimonadota bacterium]
MKRWLAAAIIIGQIPALLPVGTFRIESTDSRVEFVMRDNRGGFTGSTDRVEGTVTVRQGEGESFAAAVEARIDARTLVTGNGLRDGQMRRDFLRTDQHPFITFRGTVSTRDRPTATTIRAVLRGQLTIREATRDVEMPIDVVALADEYRATGEVVVKLSEYGIPIPRFLIFVAEDPVTVRLRIRLRRI